MKSGILVLDEKTNRYSISFENGDYLELHCGDIFECSPELNGYITVRIEYDEDWYLVDKKNNKIKIWQNMFARK